MDKEKYYMEYNTPQELSDNSNMIKKNTEKNYVLEFSSTESFYTEKEKIEIGESQGYNWMATYIGDNIGKLYKNFRGMGSIGAMNKGSADRYFQKKQKHL